MKLWFVGGLVPGVWFLDPCFGVGMCVGAILHGSGFSSWTGGSGDFGSVKSFSLFFHLVDCGLVIDLMLFRPGLYFLWVC